MDYNSVYNLYLQTLYEISVVIGDNITAASDTVSNANSHTSPSLLANELENSFDSKLNTTVSDGDQGERQITDNFYYRLMAEVNRTENGLNHMMNVLTYNSIQAGLFNLFVKGAFLCTFTGCLAYTTALV